MTNTHRLNTLDMPAHQPTIADLEHRLDTLRELVRQHPESRGYHEPERAALRLQLTRMRNPECRKQTTLQSITGWFAFFCLLGLAIASLLYYFDVLFMGVPK